MPSVLAPLVALGGLVALLIVAFRHPTPPIEAGAAALAVVAMLTLGGESLGSAGSQVLRLLPVVAFLSAILLVAGLSARAGLFAALGALLTRRSGGRPRRLLLLVFVVAALVTAALSLDATVVLLTPVVVAGASALGTSTRPAAFTCARLANSASLLLPVSNLTNLLALPWLGLDFPGFVVAMAPVWLVALAVEYAGLRWFFRRDLSRVVEPTAQAPGPLAGSAPQHAGLPRWPLVVVVVMLLGFAAGSAVGIAPAWVAGTAAAALALESLTRRRVRLSELVATAQLSFGVYVLGLGVTVQALAGGPVGDQVRRLLPSDTGLLSLLLVAVLATATANLLNNLPTTLLLVPMVAPLGDTAVLAALVGLNVGAGLTLPGSLSNLLWRRSLAAAGSPPSVVDFHRLSLLVTPPAVLAATTTLWAFNHA